MGRARITQTNLTTPRYNVEIDTGQEVKVARLMKLQQQLNDLEIRLQVDQDNLQQLKILEAEERQKMEEATVAYTTAIANLKPGDKFPPPDAYKKALESYRKRQGATAAQQRKVDALKLRQSQLQKEQDYWDTLQVTETGQLWVADYWPNLFAGFNVATIEIDDEFGTTVIAPGGRLPTADDGRVVSREVQSPEQVFFNAAILPGVQAEKPKYRLGTITALDNQSHTCNLTLSAAVSSAQSLPINVLEELSEVPIVYQSCNSFAFDIGDKVIVEFVNRDWIQPRVIGFRENPYPCEDWGVISIFGQYRTRNTTPFNGATRPKRRWCLGLFGGASVFSGGIGDYRDLWCAGTGEAEFLFSPVLQPNRPTARINVDLPPPVLLSKVVNEIYFPEDQGRSFPFVAYEGTTYRRVKSHSWSNLATAPRLTALFEDAPFVSVSGRGQLNLGTNSGSFGTFSGELYRTQYEQPGGYWGHHFTSGLYGPYVSPWAPDVEVTYDVPIPVVSRTYRGLTRGYRFVEASASGAFVTLYYEVEPL